MSQEFVNQTREKIRQLPFVRNWFQNRNLLYLQERFNVQSGQVTAEVKTVLVERLLDQEIEQLILIQQALLDVKETNCLNGSVSLREVEDHSENVFKGIDSQFSRTLPPNSPYYSLGFEPYGVPYRLPGRGKQTILMGLTDLVAIINEHRQLVLSRPPSVVYGTTNATMANTMVEQMGFHFAGVRELYPFAYGFYPVDHTGAGAKRLLHQHLRLAQSRPDKPNMFLRYSFQIFAPTEYFFGGRLEKHALQMQNHIYERLGAEMPETSRVNIHRMARIDAIRYLAGI